MTALKHAAPYLDGGRCLERGNPDDFTNEDRETSGIIARRRAVLVCRDCPVIRACGAWATEQQFTGVWGGRYRR